MSLYRLDYSPLGKSETTPQGGLKIDASLTRTGVFEYHTPTGIVREYRPPEEVFSADSLASLRNAPITLDHPPPGEVSPDNFRQYALGHVGEDVRQRGDMLDATLYIQDQQALRAINAGRREVSCGYNCDIDPTPGVTPDGERYDQVQRNIRYNHLALVDVARAGRDARLHLDSAGNCSQPKGNQTMEFEIIEGVKYEVGSDAHRAARVRCDSANAEVATKLSRLDTLTKELDAARADAAATKAKHEKLASEIKETLTPARLDAAAANRARVVEKARAILGKEIKLDGLGNDEIRKLAVVKAFPTIKLDGETKDFVRGLWRAIGEKETTEAARRNDALITLRNDTRPLVSPSVDENGIALPAENTVERARYDAMEKQDLRSASPLAMSRRDRYKDVSGSPMIQSAQLETMK